MVKGGFQQCFANHFLCLPVFRVVAPFSLGAVNFIIPHKWRKMALFLLPETIAKFYFLCYNKWCSWCSAFGGVYGLFFKKI